MINISEIIQEDTNFLLSRALLNKSIAAFGEDGNGKHGRHYYAKHFKISGIEVNVNEIEDDIFDVKLHVLLEDYDSKILGFMETDINAMLSIGNLLSNEEIDRNCLSWVEPGDLPLRSNEIVFSVDLKLLELC